jgi:formylglycine-generating enzyme
MLLVPGGTFLMGCASGRPDEAPVHEVEVDPFRIGRTPVTCTQYGLFLRSTGHPSPPWWTRDEFAAPDQPVVGITWFDAMAYTDWLSLKDARRFRLPTEAEWERAARGGLEGAPTPWGAVVPDNEIPGGPLRAPWPIGRGTPNGFGLCDVGTMVHEWCLDWYRPEYYRASPGRNPRGPDEGQRRSSRGGSWRHHVRWSSPSARSSLPPDYCYSDYGFRVLEELR